jgi:hypothetical protein
VYVIKDNEENETTRIINNFFFNFKETRS